MELMGNKRLERIKIENVLVKVKKNLNKYKKKTGHR